MQEDDQAPGDVAGDTTQGDGRIAKLPSADRSEALRIIEARLFASSEPVRKQSLAELLPEDADLDALLEELRGLYAGRGVNLVAVGDAWFFRTAEDLAYVMQRYAREERRLSKAALETLSIIAYHQPVTRAEIEEVRGVATSKGTLDALMELGWVRPRGRRRAPGRPVTYGTTQDFLAHFTLESLSDLPGLAELKGAGLLSANLPPDFEVPEPKAVAELMPDELPLEPGDEELAVGDLFAETDASGEDGDGSDDGERRNIADVDEDHDADAGLDQGADANARKAQDAKAQDAVATTFEADDREP